MTFGILWYGKTRVKSYKLPVAGYELRVTSWKFEAWVDSLKARVKIQNLSPNPPVRSSNSRVTSSNPRVTSSNPRVTSSNSQVTSLNPQITSSNLRVTSSNSGAQITSSKNRMPVFFVEIRI